MRAAEVLARLTELGVKVKAEGGAVLVAPAEKVTPEVRAVVTEYKETLLAALRPMPLKGIGRGCGRCGNQIYTRVVDGWQCDHCRMVFEVIGGSRGPLPYEQQIYNR
jgi:hypothetical protein